MTTPRKLAESLINAALLKARYSQEFIDDAFKQIQPYYNKLQEHRPDADAEFYIEKALNRLDINWSLREGYDNIDVLTIYPKSAQNQPGDDTDRDQMS